MSDATPSGPGRPPGRRADPEGHAPPPRPDPLGSLAPAARSAVLAGFRADAHARLRGLLAAAAVEDRETVARLAVGLAVDAQAVGLEPVRMAARALARAAETRADLGAPTLALTRALEDVPHPGPD